MLLRQQPLSLRGDPTSWEHVPRPFTPSPSLAAEASEEIWGKNRAVIAKAHLDLHPTLIVVNTFEFTNGIFLSVEVVCLVFLNQTFEYNPKS